MICTCCWFILAADSIEKMIYCFKGKKQRKHKGQSESESELKSSFVLF
jgi:hypothetical protein